MLGMFKRKEVPKAEEIEASSEGDSK